MADTQDGGGGQVRSDLHRSEKGRDVVRLALERLHATSHADILGLVESSFI